ncbi:hypothetical protein ACOMHN_003470 [Nucella lapillus]
MGVQRMVTKTTHSPSQLGGVFSLTAHVHEDCESVIAILFVLLRMVGPIYLCNDVLPGPYAGALRRWLSSRRQGPGEEAEESSEEDSEDENPAVKEESSEEDSEDENPAVKEESSEEDSEDENPAVKEESSEEDSEDENPAVKDQIMAKPQSKKHKAKPQSKKHKAKPQSKKRKFVQEGLFKAELNEFLTRELAEDGYRGVEMRVTSTCTEIIILATCTQDVLGKYGCRIRELTSAVQKRFNFPEGTVELQLFAEKVELRGLCAIDQCESLRCRFKVGHGLKRACNGMLRFIMESGAKGCEVVLSGQSIKTMKFTDGLMIPSGEPLVDTAVGQVLFGQKLLDVKVKIMLPWEPKGKIGPRRPLPDHVSILEPKDEAAPLHPYSKHFEAKPTDPALATKGAATGAAWPPLCSKSRKTDE